MDADRFDTLTRSLFRAGSRRHALTAALGAVLATHGLTNPDELWAAKSGKCKPDCGECEKCDKGRCKKKNGKKKCKKGKCKAKSDGTTCSIGTCQGGTCIDPNACTSSPTACTTDPSLTPCGPAGSCFCAPPTPGATSGFCANAPMGVVPECGAGGTCATPGQRCISACGTPVCVFPCS